MASKNKTSRLGLNQWEASDRPQRGDFNADNLIIDETLGGHVGSTGIHLTSAEKSRVSQPVKVLGYQGNGSAQQTMTLDSVPTGVIVYCDTKPTQYYDVQAGYEKVYSAFAFYGAGATAGVTQEGKVLTFKQDSAPVNGVCNCLNESGRQYKVIVIK